jgi:hypothetical protein
MPKIAATTLNVIVSFVGEPAARAASRSSGRLEMPPRKKATPTSPTRAAPIAPVNLAPALAATAMSTTEQSALSIRILRFPLNAIHQFSNVLKRDIYD